MRKNISGFVILIFFLIILTNKVQAQTDRINLYGTITDGKSGEPLIGANLLIYRDSLKQSEMYRGAATNRFGFYSIPNISPGEYFLFISCIGFESVMRKADLSTASKQFEFNLKLNPTSITLGEVVVRDRRETDFSSTTSTIEVNPALIKQLPSLGGEPDIFRALQLLPGVSSATEISTGVYVRGGSPDQNLTLVDGVVVYNPSHLGGFASTFNSEALKDIKLIKGGFPAEYGSRLSSVLDIGMREGTREKFKGTLSISNISSRVTMEGPLDTSSTFILSGRTMYLDRLLSVSDKFDNIPRYNFADANAKINFVLSDRNRIFFSGFFSQDNISESPSSSDVGFDISWTNATVNLTWTNISSSTLFHNTSLLYTNYRFSTLIKDKIPVGQPFDFFTDSEIHDFSIKRSTEVFAAENHVIKAGAEFVYHAFSTTTSDFFVPELKYKPFYGDKIGALEAALYVQDEWKISEDFLGNFGFRFYYFPNGKLLTGEPRISLTYYLTDRFILRSAFAVVNQTLHMVSRSDVYLPTDLWYPSTEKIKPGRSIQGSFGFEVTSFERTFLFTAEVFYKDLKNLYEYQDNSDFSFGVNLEDQLTQGRGEAYGFEMFFNKRIGRLNGWLGYTLGYTRRYFAELNAGNPYYPRYDRRHDISFVLGYDFNPNFNLGLTWVYGTGQAYFLPIGQYSITGMTNPYNNQNNTYYLSSAKDAFRLPAFHKLDLSTRYIFLLKDSELEINLNLYNVYNQYNVFSKYIGYKIDPETGEKYPVLKQFTLFPFLPTIGVTYRF